MRARTPIAPTKGGRISGTRIAASKTFLNGKECPALSTASGSAMSTHSRVVPTAIESAFSSPAMVVGSSKMSFRWSSVQPSPVDGSAAKPPRTVSRIG